MIAYIKGTIIDSSLGYLTIETSGIGYRVFVTTKTATENTFVVGGKNKTISLWIHHVVREDAENLFGFEDKEELAMFELLMTVSGIGPKSALSILNASTVKTIKEGVRSGDAGYLSKISGISKKNSEKIILGLKEKLSEFESDFEGSEQNKDKNSIAIDALVSLGYSEKDARDAVRKIGPSENPEDIIKKALKKIGTN